MHTPAAIIRALAAALLFWWQPACQNVVKSASVRNADLQGATSYDERVDIFSAGVTVFELFRPFATGAREPASAAHRPALFRPSACCHFFYLSHNH